MYLEVKRKLFWYVRVVGKNGEPVLTSETYYSRGNAVRAAKRASKLLKVPIK